MVIFDGSFMHGNVINETEFTRVSFDFRVVPLSQYKWNDSKSVNEGRKLDIGEYFSEWVN